MQPAAGTADMGFATSPDGVRLAYRRAGPRDGPVVVLCHGLAAGSAQFVPDIEHFAALGYRVIAPDVRGHGRSAAPDTFEPARFTIATLSADMLAVLDEEGAGRVHWVGNSLGGIVGFDLAARAPERLETLATFGTAHKLDLPALSGAAIPWIYRVFGPRFTAWSTALTTTRHKPSRPLIASMIAGFEPRVGAAIAENVRNYDLTEAALGFSGPMLLMRGRFDGPVNRALSGTLPRFEGRPGFTLVELAEGGHCANLDASEAWRAALLAFWRRHGTGRER